jgi:MFS transporter, UMF1 family
MIPIGKEAEYYSFYEVSERGTSWTGPLIFGLANQIAHSLRWGILALIVYFLAGMFILPFVNVKKAMQDVKDYDSNKE